MIDMSEISKYAMVVGGVVDNICIWDGNNDISQGGWQPPSGTSMIQLPADSTVGIGWTYDGINFHPKPEADPQP